MGYTAYNSLYAAKNRELFLSGKIRAERVELAHTHLRRAQELRPDGVTSYYRQGMLFRQIERKTDKALPLFQKAVANWDALSDEDRQVRHQERKNFIKALYQLAGSLLEGGSARQSLEALNRCIREDSDSNHISSIYKYFALGKVLFQLGSYKEARDALLFSLKAASEHDPIDFVCELLGRVYLAMKDTEKALEVIEKVPEKRRRPYYRWTEADVLCALGRLEKAKEVLIRSQERDARSRHKSLLRLAKIEYLLGRFRKGFEYAAEAAAFFGEKWGGIYNDGLFWQALCAYRLGDLEKVRELAALIRSNNPRYPKLDLLLRKAAAA
jgi:tetratricopeptide (TPR) repeat protein